MWKDEFRVRHHFLFTSKWVGNNLPNLIDLNENKVMSRFHVVAKAKLKPLLLHGLAALQNPFAGYPTLPEFQMTADKASVLV